MCADTTLAPAVESSTSSIRDPSSTASVPGRIRTRRARRDGARRSGFDMLARVRPLIADRRLCELVRFSGSMRISTSPRSGSDRRSFTNASPRAVDEKSCSSTTTRGRWARDDVDYMSGIRVRDGDQVCGRADHFAPAGDQVLRCDEYGRGVFRRSWAQVLGVGNRHVTSLAARCGASRAPPVTVSPNLETSHS